MIVIKNKYATFTFDPALYTKIRQKHPSPISLNTKLHDSNLINKKIKYLIPPYKTGTIISVIKTWNCGWFIELEIDFNDNSKEIVPWENISCINPEITDILNISKLRYEIT